MYVPLTTRIDFGTYAQRVKTRRVPQRALPPAVRSRVITPVPDSPRVLLIGVERVWVAGVFDQQGTEESGRAEGTEAAAAAATRGGRCGGWRRCRQSGGERLR